MQSTGPRPFMECFYALADVDIATRHSATEDLIKHLRGEISISEARKPDINYAIKRLVRGLCSSRGAARQGFSLALSEILQSFDDSEVATSSVIEQLDSVRTRPQNVGKSAKSGQDERDLMFAGIFGCLAIQQSGRLKSKSAAKATTKLVQVLLSVAKKKRWAKQSCYEVVLTILQELSLERGEEEVLPHLKALFLVRRNHSANANGDEGEDKNADAPGEDKNVQALETYAESLEDFDTEQLQLGLGLQVWLMASTKGDKAAMKRVGAGAGLPKAVYSTKSMVRSGHVKHVVNALQESARFSPGVHAVWGHVIRALMDEERKGKSMLREFWVEGIEAPLMRSTQQRRALAFEIFRHLLPQLNVLQAPQLCTPTVLYSLAVHLASADSHLHMSARLCMKTLLSVAEKSMEMRSALVSAILVSDPHFDQRSQPKNKRKSKKGKKKGQASAQSYEGPTARLLKGLDGPAFQNYIDFLKAQILEPTLDATEKGASENADDGVDARRVWAIDALYASTKNAIRKGQEKKDEASISKILEFLFDCAYLVDSSMVLSLPHKIRTVCAQRLFSLLSDLTVDEDRTSGKWAKLIHDHWDKKEKSKKVKFVKGADEDTVAAKKAMGRLLGDIQKTLGKKKIDEELAAQLTAYRSLVLHVGLSLLSALSENRSNADGDDDDESSVVDEMTELQEIYKKLFGDAKKSKKKPKKKKGVDQESLILVLDDDEEGEEGAGAEEPDATSVFVDVLLGMLTQSKTLHQRLLRDVANATFRALCPLLSAAAVSNLLKALEQEQNLDMEEEDDDEFGLIDPSQVKDAGSSDGESSSGSDDEEDAKPSPKRSGKGSKLPRDEDEVEDDSDSDDPEEHVGEDEYMALLESRFGMLSRKSKKRDALEIQRQELNFKMRVLDMIEIYLRRNSSSIFAPQMLMSFMRALRACYESIDKGSSDKKERLSRKSLLDRLLRVLNSRLLGKKDVPERQFVVATSDVLHKCFEDLVKEALTAPIPKHEEIASLCAIYVLRTLRSTRENDGNELFGALDIDRVKKSLNFALVNFLRKKNSKLTEKFFSNIFLRQPDVAMSTLAAGLTAAAASTPTTSSKKASTPVCRTQFDRVMVFRLMMLLLRHAGVDRSKSVVGDVAKAFSSFLGEKDTVGMRAKRLRPLFEFGMQLSKTIKASGAKVDEKAMKQIAGGLGRVREGAESNAIKSICVRVEQAFSGEEVVVPSRKKKEKKRKIEQSDDKDKVESTTKKSKKKKSKKSKK